MNNKFKIKNYKKILLCCFIVFLFSLNVVMAESVNVLGKPVDTDSLNGFIQIAINLAAWILGITGSLALLFFIYGGVMFLISGGSSERVQQAKQIIVGSIIGVVIVLTSFMIINFVLTSLGYTSPCGNPWYQLITNCT